MTITEELARYLVSVSFKNLPNETIELVKLAFLDFLGSAWTAVGETTANKYFDLTRILGGTGRGQLIGGGVAGIGFASCYNAALSHISETTDLQRASSMHVGEVVFPPLLALSDTVGFDGERFIEAAVCGYEAGIRIGSGFGQRHSSLFQTSGTAGTFASAAACAKYLKLDFNQFVDALGHAGTQAAGLWQFLLDGAFQAKSLHVGKAAMNGIISAVLAKRGVSGAKNILEGEKSFGTICLPDKNMRQIILSGLGTSYKIHEIGFKSYPCCAQIHSMVDALGLLMCENHLNADDIISVESRIYQKSMDLTNLPNPRTIEEARFSQQFCLALVLIKGSLGFNDISLENLNNKRIFSQMKKIRLVVDPEMDQLFPKMRPCIVSVTDNEGHTYTKKNYWRKGDPEIPLDQSGIKQKFISLTEKKILPDVREEIIKWVLSLQKQKRILSSVFTGRHEKFF